MKPIQKLISVLLTLLIIFNTVQPVKIQAADHILAKDHPLIQAISEGTETNSDYSFSIKRNSKTTAEFWGYDGKIIHITTINNSMIMPQDNSLSGKIGHWFYNVGSYKGHIIDVKCTYYWKPLAIEGQMTYPVLGWSFSGDRLWAPFKHRSYEIKYEFYSEGKPITISASLTLGDVDGNQYYGVKSDKIQSIKCLDNCTVYFKEQDGYYWAYADEHASPNVIEDTLRFELKDVQSFYFVAGVYCDSQVYDMDLIAPHDDTVTLAQNKKAIAIFEAATHDEIVEWTAGGGYFNAQAYGPYSVPSPVEYVADSNETKSFNNILSKDETFKYNIYQYVPLETSTYYYSSFKMTNTLPDNVEYISAKVYDDSGTDVSSKFSITQNGNTIIAVANDTSIESFYYTEYNLEITVKLKTDLFITEGQKEYNFSNKTTTTIIRNGKTTTLDSNTVTSNYYEKDITVTKEWVDDNNFLSYRPQNVIINIKADGSDYDSIILDGSGNTWTKTIQVPKFNPDGTEIIYTATELKITLPNGDKYVPTETGLSITNTLTGEKELTITKVWKDDENAYQTRPDSLNIFVFQNNIKIDTISLSSENTIDNSTWQIKKNYPKYDTNGKEYVYTIQEDENNLNLLYFYDPDKITYDQNTLTVTNYGIWMVLNANDIPDDYKHTITIHKDIVGNAEAFGRLMLSPDDTYIFPIVLKQMNLTYSKGETSMLENYEGFSGNIYTGYVTNKNDLIFADIPAGKYEVSEETVQYFDFNGFSLSLTSQGASFTEEDGKYYITISSLTKTNEFITINSQSILIEEKPYTDKSIISNLFEIIQI